MWEDPDAALDRWLDVKDDLLAGRTLRPNTDELTVKELADRFLTSKRHQLDICEISARSFKDYFEICQRIADVFGKDRPISDLMPVDFEHLRAEFASTHGPARLAKDITVSRMMFKYGAENQLLERPVVFGSAFKVPKKAIRLRARRRNGRKDFDAEELRRIIDEAPEPVRTMILLGINGGFGQSDIAGLPLSAADLDNGWIHYPRPKTEVDRRISLRPQTVEALRKAIAKRPAANPDLFME